MSGVVYLWDVRLLAPRAHRVHCERRSCRCQDHRDRVPCGLGAAALARGSCTQRTRLVPPRGARRALVDARHLTWSRCSSRSCSSMRSRRSRPDRPRSLSRAVVVLTMLRRDEPSIRASSGTQRGEWPWPGPPANRVSPASPSLARAESRWWLQLVWLVPHRRGADRRLARGEGDPRRGPTITITFQNGRGPRGRQDQDQVQERRHRFGEERHALAGPQAVIATAELVKDATPHPGRRHALLGGAPAHLRRDGARPRRRCCRVRSSAWTSGQSQAMPARDFVKASTARRSLRSIRRAASSCSCSEAHLASARHRLARVLPAAFRSGQVPRRAIRARRGRLRRDASWSSSTSLTTSSSALEHALLERQRHRHDARCRRRQARNGIARFADPSAASRSRRPMDAPRSLVATSAIPSFALLPQSRRAVKHPDTAAHAVRHGLQRVRARA